MRNKLSKTGHQDLVWGDGPERRKIKSKVTYTTSESQKEKEIKPEGKMDNELKRKGGMAGKQKIQAEKGGGFVRHKEKDEMMVGGKMREMITKGEACALKTPK